MTRSEYEDHCLSPDEPRRRREEPPEELPSYVCGYCGQPILSTYHEDRIRNCKVCEPCYQKCVQFLRDHPYKPAP